MPKPSKSESKQDFLKRCTAELIDKEGRKSDQAFAMCNSFWDDSKNERPIMELSAPVMLAKSGENEAKKEFFITAYTGKPFDTWFGKVVFDVAGMKTKKKMPVLREHARDRIVGFGKSFTDPDKNELYVSGEFSGATEDAKEVYSLASEGYPWQASVAVWARKVLILEDDKQSEVVNGETVVGPAEIWTKSDVGEVSFVTLGRDDNTAAITLSEKAERTRVEFETVASDPKQTVNTTAADFVFVDQINKNSKESEAMEITLDVLKESAPELLAQIENDAFETGRKQGVEDERNRVVELLDADADPDETRTAIESGIDSAQAYKQFYQAEKSKRAAGLDEMQTEATDSQGSEEPVEQAPPEQKTKAQLRRAWRPEVGPAAEAA